ncbi:MAG: hypothetical protein K2X93_27640 [Candidatus Obscuribacterales bacterium]|nr:hypothetical protein [Candidatus Obscuribacterales bacterium]
MGGEKNNKQGPASDPDVKPAPPQPMVEMLLDEDVNDRLDTEEGSFEDRAGELLSNDLDDVTLQQISGAKGSRGEVGGLPSVSFDMPESGKATESNPADETVSEATDRAESVNPIDTLFEIARDRYAIVLIDIVSNKTTDQSAREQAMHRVSDALMGKHISCSGTKDGKEISAESSAFDDLSEEQLKGQLASIASQHNDPDTRALAVALIYRHDIQLTSVGVNDRPISLDSFNAASVPGTFHDRLVTDLKKSLEVPLPSFDYSDKDSLAEFDARRREKICAAKALSYLESGSVDATQAINQALLSTIQFDDSGWTSALRQHSEKPDIKATTDATMMLIERARVLSEEQRSVLRTSSNALLDIDFDDRAESYNAQQGNADARHSKMLLIENLSKLYSGFKSNESTDHHLQYQDQKQVAEQILRELLISSHGWGKDAEMRGAAVDGLKTFGPGLNDANIRAIAGRLDPSQNEDQQVRIRAIQALNAMTDKSIFRKSPEQLAKEGLPDLNVEHLLQTDLDPVAQATLLEIARESLSYRDPASFQAQIEDSTYVSDLRAVDFVDVNEKDIRSWLINSRFQYLDQHTIAEDANRASEKYNSGGWLGWNSVRAFFGYGTSKEFEGLKLELDRDQQLKEITDFQQLSDSDQQMAIHTLLHLCRDAGQNLIRQDDEALFRTFAAKKLSQLAEISSANNDVVKDKRLLRAAVVMAFTSMPSDMPGEARMELVKAVNSLTDRDFGRDLKSGDQPSDYTVITPQRAAALFRARLTKEAQNEAIALRTDAPAYRFDPTAGKYSEKVQLELIDSLYRFRDLGCYKELRERGSTPGIGAGPTQRGSRIDSVRNRAREVFEDLYYGVEWLREDSHKKGQGDSTNANTGYGVSSQKRGKDTEYGARTDSSIDGGASAPDNSEIPDESAVRSNLTNDAVAIQNQLLVDQQERNFEPLTRTIFRSQQEYRIGVTDDPRVGVLQQALDHKVERVRLAAANALSESALPPKSPEMIDVRNTLYELTKFGQRSIFQKEAGELLVALKEREYGTDKIRTPDQLIHGVAWMAHTARPGGGPAEMLKIMQSATTESRKEDDKSFDALIEKKNALVKDSYNAAGLIVPITTQDDPRRAQLNKALESSDVRVRFAAAQVLRTSIVEGDRASAEGPLKELESARESLGTANQESLARAIIIANFDSPITSKNDPRRDFLIGSLDHGNERIELASAWIMAQSSLSDDREAAMKKLAVLAVHSSHEVGREEALTILSDITNYGNLEDQLFAYNALKDVMVAKDGPSAVPPFSIPNEYSSAINYFERAQRTSLLTIFEDGSPTDLKNAIMAITGLDKEQLDKAIRSEFQSNVRSRQSGEQDLSAATTLSRGVKCATHRPDDKSIGSFSEPVLTEAQEAKTLQTIVSKLIADERQVSRTPVPNVRVRDIGSPVERFESALKDFVGLFEDGRLLADQGLSDWSVLASTDRSPTWCKSHQAARTLPRWTPSHRIDPHNLFSIEAKAPGVLSDAVACALFEELGGAYSPRFARVAAQRMADEQPVYEGDEAPIKTQNFGLAPSQPSTPEFVAVDALTDAADKTAPPNDTAIEVRQPEPSTASADRTSQPKVTQPRVDSTDKRSKSSAAVPSSSTTQSPSKFGQELEQRADFSETMPSDTAAAKAASDVVSIIEKLPREVATTEGDRNRTKLKSVFPELNDLFGRLPINPAFNQPVDHQVLSDKILCRDFVHMTPAELQIVMKLERDVPGFGEFTKFKGTESIYRDVNQFLNTAVVESHDILHELKLSMGPGDPLGIVRIGTDPERPDEGIPAHPDTISSLIKDGQLDVEQFRKMAASGHLKSSLLFEPNGIPDSSSLDKMSNSFDWLYANQVRIANSRSRIDANNQYKFLSDYLHIRKPGWAPDKVADKDLEAYNRRLREVLNLTLQVRNTVEAMQSLDNVKGDFDPEKAFKDLQKLTVPGGFHFDQARKRVTELKLILPEHLVGTSVNDKPIQDLKDWLFENRGPVDQAMDEYMRGEFIRYMDLHEKGVVGVKGDGDIAYVEDSNGPVAVFDPDNNLMIKRGIDGATFFYQANPNGAGESRLPYGQEVPPEKVKELFARSKDIAVEKPFDYINQKFSVSEDGEYVNVQSRKTYYQDHALNYQHWFGTHQADSVDSRQLKFDQYIIAQGQTGREQLIRADRLREFQAIQAFFHHGSKFGSAALDFGMIATGGMSLGASLAAKSTTMALVNGGRIMLGVGGLLDPAFRQMGVTGEAVRTARHVIMIADVTQGLGRQGLAMVNGGKLLFESAKAAEVAKIIEASNTMRRTESAIRYVFGAADGVWLPLMGTEATHHIERMRGQNPARYLERGLKDRGSPLDSELMQKPIATGATDDVVQSAEKVFALYGDTINDTDVRRIFAECLNALTVDQQSDRASQYLKMFHPSADALTEWRDQQYAGQWVPLKSASAQRIRPGDLKPEVSTNSNERVAAAISLLYLAQQDGKLPADGVLVKREARVGVSSFLHKPGLPTMRVGKVQEEEDVHVESSSTDGVLKRFTDASVTAAKSMAGIDIHVLPAEKVEQKVTIQDVIRVLRDAALDASSPPTQIVAADALFRAGAMPAGRYAGTLFDVVNNKKSDRSIQEKAMKQLAGALMLKHIEEADPAMTVEQRAQKEADSFGLSEEHLEKFIGSIAKQHESADVRALAAALLYQHEVQLDGGILTFQGNLLDSFDGSAESGKFHDDLIADLKKTLELPIPPYQYSERDSVKEFDALRKEKVRAARALSYLEGGVGEGNYTQAINVALASTLEMPDEKWTSAQRLHSEKPDINLTVEAVLMLAERRNLLDQEQRSRLRSASSAIMEIGFDSRVESETARRGNTDAYVAKIQVVENLGKIFPGINYSDSHEHQSQYQEERQMVEQSLQEMLMTREGWGQFNPMRVAAIQGLEKFGPGLRDSNVIKIANLLGAEVKDPYVRARAIQALSSITENSVFRASPVDLAKRGLPNLNVEHLLRTETDPLAVATLFEIGQESLSYGDPTTFRAEIESSAYVNDLRSVDFVDVSEKEIHEWLSDSRFQYVDQHTIKTDANQATAVFNSGGWLEWKSARTFFGFGTSQEYESVKLEVGRDKQLEEMGDFQLLSQRDQQMAIHTLLHLCRDANQNLIKQEDEEVFRTFAARKLANLAEVSLDKSDVVKDKRLLRAAVVLAFDSMPSDMPGPARMHLIDAVNSLTDRNSGKSSPSGSQPTDNTIITPQRAAALFRAQLTKEAEHEALALRPESPHYRFDPPAGQSSEKVQLALIDSLYQLRDLGSFKELNERGCDPALDPSARGSRIEKVKQRARDVVEDLYYGVDWIRDESTKAVKTRSDIEDRVDRYNATGSGSRTTFSADTGVKHVPVPADSALQEQLDAEAESIESHLVENQQERNFEQLTFKIYRSQLENPLGGSEDPRVAVLHRALRHNVQRVQLAAAEALSQSRLPPDSKEMIDARDKLYVLTGYGRRRIFQKEAGEILVAMKEREYGTDKIRTPEQLVHGVAWMAHTKPEGDQAVMLERMQNAMSASKIEVDSKSFDILIDKKNPLVKQSYTADGRIVVITAEDDPRRGKLLQALESDDERVRFAAAHVLQASAIQKDRVSAEPELANFESAKARLYTINQETLARTVIAANADLPIKLKDDPRRQFLLGAIDHDNERVALASAWMMSQSAMPLDRETAIRKLSQLAVHSSHEVGREEAMTILSDIASYGNLDDQLFAYNTLRDVMVAKDGPAALPPFAIPNEYSKAINYLERAPRSWLQSIREDGSLREMKEAIMAITGLSNAQLSAAIRAEYYNSIRPHRADGDFEAARMAALFSGVKCASHNPEHHNGPVHDFPEPALTEIQEGQAVDLIVAKLVESQGKLNSSNVRVRDLMSSIKLGDARVQAQVASLSVSEFDSVRTPTDWTGLSQLDRRPSWSESEQAHSARTLPRWTPSHEMDTPDLNRLKVREHGVMSDQEARALFSGAGSLYDRASAKLAGSINADLKRLQALLSEEQPGNCRVVIEALYSTFKHQPLAPYQPDPRREMLKDVALNHNNDRVRLAAAWMLINSAARQDVADGTKVVAEMYVNGKISDTIRGETRALLEDMVFYGGDRERRHALDLWQDAYSSSGEKQDERKPPDTKSLAVEDVGQARRYFRYLQETHSEYNLFGRSVEDKKAIVLQMHRALNPDRPMSEAQLDARTMPVFIPLTGLSSTPYTRSPLSGNGWYPTAPQDFFSRRRSSSPYAPSSDTFINSTRSGRTWPLSPQPGIERELDAGKVGPVMAKWMRENSYAGLESAEFKFDPEKGSTFVVGDGERHVLSGDYSELTGFKESAPKVELAKFFMQLLKSRPEIRSSTGIKPELLADMYVQSLRGRPVELISDTVADTTSPLNIGMSDPLWRSKLNPKEREAVVSSFEAARKQRDTSHRLNLDWELERLLDETPPAAPAFSARWKPTDPSSKKVEPPAVFRKPAIDRLELFRSDRSALLSQDLLEVATQNDGTIPISYLENFAHLHGGTASDAESIQVYPRLSSDVAGDYVVKDRSTWKVVNENQARKLLRLFPIERKTDR